MKHRYYQYSLLLLLVLLCSDVTGQEVPAIEWDKYFGGHRPDEAIQLIEDIEGNISLAGNTRSKANREKDMFFLRVDKNGENIVQENYGGKGEDGAMAISQAFDGGFHIAGYTNSEWPNSVNGQDAWVIKVDEKGLPLWDKIYGTNGSDEFRAIVQKQDGNLILLINTEKKLGLIELNGTDAESIWVKPNLLNKPAIGNAISLDNKGNIIVTGYYEDESSKKSLLLAKFNSQGGLMWERSFEDETLKEGKDLVITRDNKYAITGISESNSKREDMFALTTNSLGYPVWINHYGGRGNDGGRGIVETSSGDFIMTGFNGSHERGARRNKLWLNKVSVSGEPKWNKKKGQYQGGKLTDEGNDVIQLSDGSLLVAGYSASNPGLENDAWLIKFEGAPFPIEPEKPRLKVGEFKLNEPSQNEFLDPSERAYISFSITNEADVEAYDIKANVNSIALKDGVRYVKNITIGYLPPKGTKLVSIPVAGAERLESGKNTFEINIAGANVDGVKSTLFSFESKRVAQPQLVISKFLINDKKEGFARRNDTVTVTATIKNIGNTDAKNCGFKIALPYKVIPITDYKFQLGTLSPEQSTTIECTFKVQAVYLDPSIKLNCRAWESTFKYGQSRIIDLPIEEESLDANPPSGNNPQGIKKGGGPWPFFGYAEDFIRINWDGFDPDIDGDTFREKNATFDCRVIVKSNKEHNASQIKIQVNGKPLGDTKFEEVKLFPSKGKKGNTFAERYVLSIPLKQGENKIEVSIQNEAGVATITPIKVTYDPIKSNLHIFSFGVPHEDLQFTSKDAEDFARTFENQDGQLFEKTFIKVFNEEESTKTQALKERLLDINISYNITEEIKDGDAIILFFSSHGFKGKAAKSFKIAASDINDLYRDVRSIDFENDVLLQLQDLNCKKFIFVDACFSGSIANIDLKPIQGSKSGKEPSDDVLAKAVINLAESNPGYHTMVSCSSGELSYEDPKWTNSSFTKALMEGFRNDEVKGRNGMIKADINEDRIIYLTELYQFMRERVPTIVQTKDPDIKQHPYMPEHQLMEDKPIFVVLDN